MKALNEYTNTDKAKLLHGFFPQEIPKLLNAIEAFCVDFRENKEAHREAWKNGFLAFDFWFSLSEETANLIKQYRVDMLKSSSVFANQLCYSYTCLFLNDRIIKYADKISHNEKFKIAVELLYKL
ncbi:hypothetical protein AQ505_12935 [Pedobacter sp. PACM 27299]|uniref:hypothetical protein n=1 Tax=Pedobacter sp. PACM 27299 TaxID=1727164 RepID=UPI000706ADC2|nr:hypothetical protein [Pedobacter sp. PACM 27299]ALL06324.1 hypothetical protein AQ505_12935 [Pedobacter sp. PACM 27299]